MSVNLNGSMYESLPEVAGLNSVKGFDPCKFMRRTVLEETKEEGFYLDLKYKKLWFRLVHPAGRIKTTVLKITNQLAIIEAKVYFDKRDTEAVSNFVAQRTIQDKAGPLYIEAAQYAAVDQALCDAGFGLQFSDVSQGPDPELYDSGTPITGAAASVPDQPLHLAKDTIPAEAPPAASVVDAAREEAPPAAPVVDAVHENDPPATSVEEAARENESPTVPVEEVVRENEPPAAPVEEAVRENEPPVPPVVEAVREPAPAEAASEQAVETVTTGDTLVAGGAEPTPGQQVEPQSPIQESTAGGEEIISDDQTARYTADMPVDEIYALMTPEEAASVISDVGNMAGQTLEAIAQRRPAVLKWYINGCNSGNNILRAGARIMLEQVMGQQLAS